VTTYSVPRGTTCVCMCLIYVIRTHFPCLLVHVHFSALHIYIHLTNQATFSLPVCVCFSTGHILPPASVMFPLRN
jgi:hypothetical protein